MSTVAVIAEFNPFHKGHAYFLREARRLTGANCCLALMSGDFVQRGAPAIYDMHMRGEMALNNGTDLVLELPVRYASSTAEKFASGAVTLLNKLGVVDYLAFGAECDSLEKLARITDILCEEPDSYRISLKEFLRSGMSFPAAREAAMESYLLKTGCEEPRPISSLLGHPNNILAIEYLKSLRLCNSLIKPILIPRLGDYHYRFFLSESTKEKPASPSHSAKKIEPSDPTYGADPAGFYLNNASIGDETAAKSDGSYSNSALFSQNSADNNGPSFLSAEAIRGLMKSSFQNQTQWKDALPDSVYSIIAADKYGSCPMIEDSFSRILRYILTMSSKEDLIEIDGISPDLAARIIVKKNDFSSFSQFTQLLKSREITYTAIARALIHIILRLKKTDAIKGNGVSQEISPGCNKSPSSSYIRLLGFRRSSSPILHEIRERSPLTLISKAAHAKGLLSEADYTSFLQDIRAAHIYEGLLSEISGLPFRHEFSRKIVILE